ncbi:MAG: sialate O-acetylesterase [Lachnospiraceae bacterium]|nr:sialate O-acetylesterase [Lachnospiraceae bacterium]
MEQLLKPAAVFSSHMVLQREKPIAFWGEGKEGIVTISLNDVSTEAVVKDGHWNAVLPPMPAGGPYEVIICQEDETITYTDVLIGEVWLAGGQSNMELELKDSEGGIEEADSFHSDSIRFYQVRHLSYVDENFYKEEAKGSWEMCQDGSQKHWSAVGYYFIKKLWQELKVPVGLISCNWGGTSASAWVRKEDLIKQDSTATYVQELEQAVAGKTKDEYEKELNEYNEWYAKWQEKVNVLYREKPDILWSEVQKIAGKNRWPEPLGIKSPFRACGLYETMLSRVRPYSLRGFLYYQGESDDHKPESYDVLLEQLIRRWRMDWNDLELPFLFVQLPMYIGREDVDHGNWAVIRKKQQQICQMIRNTGMAVILDCGTFDNIHPLNKRIPGWRLADLALYQVYQNGKGKSGPFYRYHVCTGQKIEVFFDHTADGIYFREDEAYRNSRKRYMPDPKKEEEERKKNPISLTGFEIAGDENIFYPASVEVMKDSVILFSEQVERPIHARYACHNFSPVTIFNTYDLPLAPFEV